MRKIPKARFCAVFLALVCLWRMFGAPLSVKDIRGIPTQLVQARILLPTRMERVLTLWYLKSQPCASAENEKNVLVYLTQENRTASMALSEYVCGVLAQEMPAQYHMEALKAQAVAARTRVMDQQLHGGCMLHPGVDICTDSAHCQGFATEKERMEKWEDNYDQYQERIVTAEKETQGQWLSYAGTPIKVLYHAMSGGKTENAQEVFAQAQPYLISVESKGEENAKDFWQETFISYEDVAQKLNQGLSDDLCTVEQLRHSLSICEYTATGRVKALQIGNQTWNASDFRKALGLRSTWFSMSMGDTGITFQQRGYGHGVGMSQVGANAMAASGADHQQILLHYYPGVTIETDE